MKTETKRQRKRKVTRTEKERAFAIWGHACVYCLTNLTKTAVAYRGSSVDHLVPVSDGGSFAWQNLVPACAVCNSIKADDDTHYAFLSPNDFGTVGNGSTKRYISDSENRYLAIEMAWYDTIEQRSRII